MHELTKLILEDMKPALGVTEPGAIAFAVSLAKSYTEGEVEHVTVALNSGMYKNAFTCGIPNSDEVGNAFAAALGVVAGIPELGLESLKHVTEQDNVSAKELIAAHKINVKMSHISSNISIEATVQTKQDVCVVRIAKTHTSVYEIEKNGTYILKKEKELEQASDASEIHCWSLQDMLQYVSKVACAEIDFIREAYTMNMALFQEGLQSPKTTFVKTLLQQNGGQLLSNDARNTAQLWCNGAIEARVLGLSKPAMSITGSGAHGIIATLPIYAYQQVVPDISEEKLLRATALSYLVTMYIKEYSGRLSAFCGCGIAAGTGMACGLCYLKGGEEAELFRTIRNMASSLTGMICDGGNQGCTMKGIVAVDAAFRSVELAMAGVAIDCVHGINGVTAEQTMRNMGRIASPGMEKTEEIIVQLMQEKQEG